MFLKIREANFQKVSEALLFIYFLFIALWQELSIVALICLTLLVVFTGKYRAAFSFIRSDLIIKIFISWFVLHVIGLIYSTDIIYGMNDIQTKLSFLIVPFVFCALDITSETYLKIRNAFIISCLFSFLLLLILSFQKYLSSHDSSEFFYTGLSHGKHATYLTIYFNLALLFIQQKYFLLFKGAFHHS